MENQKSLLHDMVLAAGWISVRSSPIHLLLDHITAGLLACSGCAGDYEDPEAMAWSEPQEEESDEGNQSTALHEFPETQLAV